MTIKYIRFRQVIEREIHMGVEKKVLACFVVMVWIFTEAGIIEGKEKGKVNLEISLPAEGAGWKWDGKEEKHGPKSVFQYMNGAAELYMAYDFQSVRVRRFEKPDQPSITLELYDMASSENAYGVFSFERQDKDVGIGQGSEFGGGMLRFWKGKYFVSIYADREGTEIESAILTMGRATADLIRETGPEPKLVQFVPGKELGLVDRSIRYLRSHVLLNQRIFIAHQNILNLNQRTEAVLAQYIQGKKKTHLLLIRYPSAKEAKDAYRSFMTAYLPNVGGKDRLKMKDQKWTMARERGEFLIIVLGAPTEADGEALLRGISSKLFYKH